MNDEKFIELLNLYVDREISLEDAGRLEAEVMKNPKRRNVYDQYCRIQKACVLISQSKGGLEVEAPEVVQFAPQRSFANRWGNRIYAGGLMAAAACVAAAIMVRRSQMSPAAAPHPLAAHSEAAPSSDLATATNLKPIFSKEEAPLFVDSELAPRLDWISQVRLSPVQQPQAADLIFTTKPDLKPANRAVQVQGPLQAPAEMTAFQIRE